MKKTNFTAKDTNGKKFTWKFWREPAQRKQPALWMLEDHTGYIRPLEQNWGDSVPQINLILRNHGMTANIS